MLEYKWLIIVITLCNNPIQNTLLNTQTMEYFQEVSPETIQNTLIRDKQEKTPVIILKADKAGICT